MLLNSPSSCAAVGRCSGCSCQAASRRRASCGGVSGARIGRSPSAATAAANSCLHDIYLETQPLLMPNFGMATTLQVLKTACLAPELQPMPLAAAASVVMSLRRGQGATHYSVQVCQAAHLPYPKLSTVWHWGFSLVQSANGKMPVAISLTVTAQAYTSEAAVVGCFCSTSGAMYSRVPTCVGRTSIVALMFMVT